MKKIVNNRASGFSLVELLLAMTLILVLMGLATTLLGRSVSVRARESRKTDALTSAQAAIGVMSREITNSGFGVFQGSSTRAAGNGLVLADCSGQRVHLRTNIDNYGDRSVPSGSTVLSTNVPGEDVTYFFDSTTNSIVRYDPNANPHTSVVVNRISNVTFEYVDFAAGSSVAAAPASTPTGSTGLIRITVTVALEAVFGQPSNQSVTFTSDVSLRNSNYMLSQY